MKINLGYLLLFFVSPLYAFPGELVSLDEIMHQAYTAEVVGAKQIYCPDGASVSEAVGFTRYRVVYKTVGVRGEEVESAGQMIFPDSQGPRPLFVYQHGTLMGRSELPSNSPPQSESAVMGVCFASRGYVTLVADYLGFGDSTGVHPYLHAATEATVARDLMRAAKHAIAQLNRQDQLDVQDQFHRQFDGKVFIAGYSQGGHAAMALARLLDQDPTQEFVITAAAPMAGPYDLVHSVKQVLEHPVANSTAEGAYILVGLNPIYEFYQTEDEAFSAKYAPLFPSLFDGSNDWPKVRSILTMTVQELFVDSYLENALNDVDSRLYKALEENEVYKWTPTFKMRLYHGGGDHEVPFSNAQIAYDFMKANGADIKIVNLGDAVGHPEGFPRAIAQAVLWFETLR